MAFRGLTFEQQKRLKEARRIYSRRMARQRYRENLEAIHESQKISRLKHRDHILAYQKAYYAKNKEKILARMKQLQLTRKQEAAGIVK